MAGSAAANGPTRTATSRPLPGVHVSGERTAAIARNWSTTAWSSGVSEPGAWPQRRKRRIVG